MDLKQYLIDTFKFNDKANKQVLEKIMQLHDKTEAIKFFSHLINCQLKWMARVNNDPNAQQMSWWEPVYVVDKLEEEWNKSLTPWIKYIISKSDTELSTETRFIGFDGGIWAASPQDIALQLNYHSIHHRAQIQTLIRQQGIEPAFVDYIGTRYKKIN